MPRRYEVSLSRSRTVTVDVPDGVTPGEFMRLVQKSTHLLDDYTQMDVDWSSSRVTLADVRESNRSGLRVSDDHKRITDEEVAWCEGGK